MNQPNHQGNKRSKAQTIVSILYWVAILAGIWFAWLNIHPYAQITKLIISSKAEDQTLWRLIAAIPLINGIAATLGLAIHWIIGALIWFIIQVLQVFPIVLKYDRHFSKVLIDAYQTANRYEIKEEDPPALAAFKRWYNNFPWMTLANARKNSLYAYGVDLAICLFVYPPAAGGFGDFMYILFTGQFDQIDWSNVISLIFTVFVIEVIVELLLWLDQVVLYMRTAHSARRV